MKRNKPFILVLCRLMGYAAVNSPASASGCAITTHSAPISNGTLSYNQVDTGQPNLATARTIC